MSDVRARLWDGFDTLIGAPLSRIPCRMGVHSRYCRGKEIAVHPLTGWWCTSRRWWRRWNWERYE